MKKIRVKIETLSPIVLATRSNTTVMTASHDFFSGTLVRGILAERYMEEAKLGERAHEDEAFLDFFFGRLRFSAAYPVRAADGRRTMVVPASVQKLKDGEAIKELLIASPETGFKTLRGFAVIEDDGIEKVEVAKNISLHMSRTNSKALQGKAAGESSLERLAGRSRNGAIYNYEAVEKGVRFEGEIFGEEADLENFLAAMGEATWTAQAGRARHAQYGACRVQLALAEFTSERVVPDEARRVYLRLETPLLAADDLLSNTPLALQPLLDCLNVDGTEEFFLHPYEPTQSVMQGDVENKIFADFTEVDNFVGIWSMKRPRAIAVAAGSVFVLEKKSAWEESDKERLQSLLYEGIGVRTEEGFGQLRLWQPGALRMTKTVPKRERRKVRSQTVREKAQALLLRALQQKMVVYAAEDARLKLERGESEPHFFTRLDSMWSLRRDNMQMSLRNEIEGQKGNADTPFVKSLFSVKVAGTPLEEFLLRANLADMPYNKNRRWKKEMGENIEAFLEDIGAPDFLTSREAQDAIFYAYWHNFFRFARKDGAGKEARTNGME